MKKNYTLIFNILLIGTLSIFFASCAREKGALSYNNDKLRKQSFEIETSGPSQDNSLTASISESSPVIVKEKNGLNVENKIFGKNDLARDKAETKKLSLAKRLIAKKIAKKLSTESKFKSLDENLRMAIIFAAIGVIFFILGFIPLFWIFGSIAMVIAVVFLVLWLLEQ